ncbi:MAG: hypothetical protein AAF196_00180 [Planctomycetota bacterium]
MKATLIRFVALGLLLGSTLTAQQLRLGVARANYVVIARQVAVQPLGDHVLHRFEVIDRLKGEPQDTFSIAVPKRVADAPSPGFETSNQLLCLRPTRRNDVPERFLPIYRLTGYQGDRFVVDDSEESQGLVSLVRALLDSESGVKPADIGDRVVDILLGGEGQARLEASETLRGRVVLRDEIPDVRADQLLLLAVGSSEDSNLKRSVARLCVEANVDNALPALCAAVHQNDDEEFATTVGRLAQFKMGEEAASAFDDLLERVRGPARDRILIAVGATRTQGALDRLRREWERSGRREGLVKALRAHGSEDAIRIIESGGERR